MYFSKNLSKAQRQYCVTRRELLAIVESEKHFHQYIYGVTFIVRTVHGSITGLRNFKNPSVTIARWLEVLRRTVLSLNFAEEFSIKLLTRFLVGRVHHVHIVKGENKRIKEPKNVTKLQ